MIRTIQSLIATTPPLSRTSTCQRVYPQSIERSRRPCLCMKPPPPASNLFPQRASAIYTCIFCLSCLVLFNIAILLLQATHFFEKHLFDIRKISAVSQIASVTTQASTVIVLIILSYVMQLLASDTIIRRSQSLAALHENLAAWRGLSSSILGVWRSRDLDVRTRFHILLPLAFFSAMSVLHIVTPAVITIGTFNSPLNFSLEVSTAFNISRDMWFGLYDTYDDPFKVVSYMWPQLGTNTTLGLPPGVKCGIQHSPQSSLTY
ncbi:hypothetical protein BS47DRAFT_182415 [Hydnum rufescens UP504]|uniref:Uncharacterized protein n=1 Tax=Hydnum rufescens UP504 TaxID=1448309 RepID=A0A9P6ANJ8_9AGAM|nr:hypothetical protein BS47DRAFT_182415 [Hydnum rufescens UP504]